jgi:hypothetical protein
LPNPVTGVASGGAYGFSEAIGNAAEQKQRPANHNRSQPHDGFAECRDRVAGGNERFAMLKAVGQRATQPAQAAADPFGQAINPAQQQRRSPRKSHEKQRHYRIEHLGRQIGKKTHPAKDYNVASNATQPEHCHLLIGPKPQHSARKTECQILPNRLW